MGVPVNTAPTAEETVIGNQKRPHAVDFGCEHPAPDYVVLSPSDTRMNRVVPKSCVFGYAGVAIERRHEGDVVAARGERAGKAERNITEATRARERVDLSRNHEYATTRHPLVRYTPASALRAPQKILLGRDCFPEPRPGLD